jgi:hypothetical protein
MEPADDLVRCGIRSRMNIIPLLGINYEIRCLRPNKKVVLVDLLILRISRLFTCSCPNLATNEWPDTNNVVHPAPNDVILSLDNVRDGLRDFPLI